MPDLSLKINDLSFRNPVTVASGTFGTKDEYRKYVDYEKLGAIITKTITVRSREGNPMPRICETSGGMINAIGLQNKGLEDFIEEKIPFFSKINTPLIVNIAGEKDADFAQLAKSLDDHESVVKAIEVNLSCPNVEAGGTNAMKKRGLIKDAVKAVRDHTKILFFAKLSPELGDVAEIAGEVLKCGATGLSLINTLKGLSIDVFKRKPRIANGTGGVSGPAIKPVALRYVYEIKKQYNCPVIASGGIMTAQDALEFVIAGADLLAIGTANFVNPRATMEILEGIENFCQEQGIPRLNDLRGTLNMDKQAKMTSW